MTMTALAAALPALQAHARRLSATGLATLAGPAHILTGPQGWRVDLSRQRLDADARAALGALAQAAGLEQARDRLFSAAIVNPSEARPALHWALRAPAPLSETAADSVRRSVIAADAFAERVFRNEARGATGEPFNAVVHIGIGGSDFGPRLLAEVLAEATAPRLTLRFCANLDPVDLELALSGLDPRRTLVVGVSKSFGTEETLYNLARARRWLEAAVGPAWPAHIALVTANAARANAWLGDAVAAAGVFDMPESVGGRFSIWSAASLAIAAVFGPHALRDFRAGAAATDAHVRDAGLADNIAMQLALNDVWNRNALDLPQRVVLAYARRLRLLPAYLQQLEMESNGKSVTPAGEALPYATAGALWGGEGTIGQHSYHQFLHQGTDVIPAEFVLALDATGEADGQRALVAHALAQAEVFANGRSLEQVQREEPTLSEAIARQKVHAGGRPCLMFVHPAFDVAALGALVALYEHRTYFSGVLWGVNSFDQWGVERGKTMADTLRAVLRGQAHAADPATARLASLFGTRFNG